MASSTFTPSPDLPIQWRDSTARETFVESCWSHTHNHRRATESRVPRAVVHATTTRHAVEAVRLAVAEGCRISVRSGGHSWAGWSVRDDAILLDLGALKDGKFDVDNDIGTTTKTTPAEPKDAGFTYDPATHILSAPPSATGRGVNAFLATHKRMFSGGHCPDVGIGGFILQGGMGWNCKNWGWACESLVGLDVVTAQGEEIYVSEKENEDLFWAARGAGPGEFSFPFFLLFIYVAIFCRAVAGDESRWDRESEIEYEIESESGNEFEFEREKANNNAGFPAIVTRFHLKTRPLGQMFQSIYFWPISEYREVLQWVIDVSASPPPSLIPL